MVKTYNPKNLNEVLGIIHKNDTLIYAGGTDIMVRAKEWSNVEPNFEKNLVFIDNLSELKGVIEKEDYISIGACEIQSDLCKNKTLPPFLREAVKSMSSPALRNIATIGGNIVNASPAGDILPALYCLDAVLVLKSLDGKRELPIEEVILGPGKTCIKSNEILTEIKIPNKKYSKSYYRKVGTRKANAITKVSVTSYQIIEEDKVREIAISFGAVGPTIVRSKKIESLICGETVEKVKSKNFIESILSEYDKCIKPIDDVRSKATYRKQVALNLIKDFLTI